MQFAGKVKMNVVVSPLHMVARPRLKLCALSFSASPSVTPAELSG